MSDAFASKPPVLFWVIGAILLLWNLTGLMIYYGHVTMTPEMIAETFSAAERAFMEQTPVWATSAYATAVTAGVIGALLMLLRKKLALPLFIVSFVAVLIQDLDAFVLRDVISVWGSRSFTLPLIIIVICVFQIWYARSTTAKGWLD